MDKVYDEKTQLKISQEFTRAEDVCYLDHAGATLYSETQMKNICHDLMQNIYGNPHSLNNSSKQSSDLVDQVRNRIVPFSSTESVTRKFPEAGRDVHIKEGIKNCLINIWICRVVLNTVIANGIWMIREGFGILKHFHTSNEEYSLIFTSGATAAIKLLLEAFDWETNQEDDSTIPISDKTATALSPKAAYIYSKNNHTSVVGGREIAKEKCIQFFCLEHEELISIMKAETVPRKTTPTSNSLFVYPAQCNFSGTKYPLEWIKKVQCGTLDSYGMDKESRNSKWFCLLDAATYCSTNDLNLSAVHPDFVCISFYKIFGYPTGLGALLVRNSSAHVLRKKYFGGGTVDISLPYQDFHQKRKVFHERFEDGTIPFLSIISLEHGLNTLKRLHLNMKLISTHVYQLARYTMTNLKTLTHWNGVKLVEIYADSDYEDIGTQGGIVNFNLRRANREYIGFVEVLHIANLRKIHLRTGCFCNSGACQRHLNLTDENLKFHFEAGHICGDTMDLINGRPTGSVRVSFGYMSTKSDADKLIKMIRESFLEAVPQTNVPKNISEKADLKLSKILTFPVKSCGAVEVKSWKLNERGLEYDREWMIVTENGICLTQKQEPRLCLILPQLDLVNRTLTLSFRTGKDSITIPIENTLLESQYDFCESKVCNDRIQAYDCGDKVAEWLSRVLFRDGLRLVRQAKESTRKSKKSNSGEQDSGKLSLSNQAQYLLINNESVKWLQRAMGQNEEINSETFSDRFRGNFYIDGGTEFCENSWSYLRIGETKFKVEGPCGRCQMICIDQQTGEKSRKPLVALSSALKGKLQFGIYLSHIQTGDGVTVSVGQPVSVEGAI